MRKSSGGAFAFMDVVEYVDNLPLTEEEWNDPDFQHFLQMANRCIITHNDIVSFEKEWLAENKNLKRMINVVALTAILDKCSIDEAMYKIGTGYQEMEAKAMAVMNKVFGTEISQNVKAFCNCVAHIIGGNFFCGDKSMRYNAMYD